MDFDRRGVAAWRLGLQPQQGGTDQPGFDAAFAAHHQRAVEFAQDAGAHGLIEFGQQRLDIG